MDRTRVEKSAPRRTAAVALLSRLLLAAVVVLTTFTIGVQNRPLFMRDPEHIEVFSGFLERLLEPWANWDGVWFIRIAADGYQAHSFSQAFFPLYPWAVQVVAAVLGGSYVVAGVTISLVCYAGAMAVLYLLASDHFGPRVAMWSVVFISVFPTAFFFQAVYSESLFLLLSLLAFWWASRGRWWQACAAGMLAALTRSSGLLLLLPLAVMWWEQRRGEPLRLPGGYGGTVASVARRPGRLSLVALALVPAGLGVYMAYLWRAFGDPLLFGAVQSHWGRATGFPPLVVWDGAVAAARGVSWLISHGVGAVLDGPRTPSGGLQSDVIANPLEFLALSIAVGLVVVCWRRLPTAFTVYALAAVLFPLLYPIAERPLSSVPRFLIVIFPLFIALAVLLEPRRRLRWVVVAISVAALIVATALFASFI